MNNKNLLLGYGETLTHDIPPPGRMNNKKHPYSYEEARVRALEETATLIENISKIPEGACPSGKAVAKFTLHPAYLAKSYYPEALFRAFGLQNIGSKAVNISPRKQTLKKPKDSLTSSCLYISGQKNSFELLQNHLEIDELSKGIKMDVRKLEDIDFYPPEEKIKSIGQKQSESKYEIALHTPEGNNEIIDSFIAYVDKCGGIADVDRAIRTGGLTFLPLTTITESAKDIAQFTFLRALRVMPELRTHKPVVTRTTISTNSPSLPDNDSINKDIKVAVFDGGIGTNNIDRWCNETIYTGGERTSHDLLSHGSEVTSTILFGIADESTKELPVPYTDIDHYRVLDPGISPDPDLFDVLIRIKQALEKKSYDFVNLSLGPRMPVEDDDVHVWTSTLEPILANGGTLVTVAVGNDGELAGQNRIQPPSDLVNALAVGASNSRDTDWSRASYSCIGPGRSPGIVKPDGLAFGGDQDKPFTIYSPLTGMISGTGGTSFASPLTLRSAIGVKTLLDHEISPLTSKALLLHHTQKKNLPQPEIGWGHFPENIDNIIYCGDNEATVVYQGELKPSQYMRAPIPFPDIPLTGKIGIKATFCFSTNVDPEHPVNYTRSGLVVTFRPKGGDGDTKSFFSLSNLYETEQDARSDAHKWETTLHRDQNFLSKSLDHPCFDIVYQAREKGQPADNSELSPLPYVLVVTIYSKKDLQIYNSIRQRYQILEPIQLRQEVQIKV